MEGLEITEMKNVPCVNSRFLSPCRVTFKQNGYQRTWDYIKQHDSVSILIHNTTRKTFVFVKQFRPAPYMSANTKMNEEDTSIIKQGECTDVHISAPFQKGVTYELCAGIVDQKKPLIEIAKSEILEETGYDVPVENLRKILQWTGVGTSGQYGHLYYAEVTDEMKKTEGGGNRHEGEFIEVAHVPLQEAKALIFNHDIAKPSGFVAAICWYFMENNEKS